MFFNSLKRIRHLIRNIVFYIFLVGSNQSREIEKIKRLSDLGYNNRNCNEHVDSKKEFEK